MRLDELIDLLPEAGLKLWRFDGEVGNWHTCLEGEVDGVLQHYSADGPTPLAAFVAAYRAAGFNVEDDGT